MLSLVILEDSCMLDTYVGEILNKIKENLNKTSWWSIVPPPLLIIGCHHQNTYSS